MIYINDTLLEFNKKNIIKLSEINPSYDKIIMPFVNDYSLDVIKYTNSIVNLEYNNINNKYYYIIPRYNIDIISNIATSNECKILFNNEHIKCNINNLILPITIMQYTSVVLEFDESSIISYDAYLLSDNIRNSLKNKKVYNSENIMFYAGGSYIMNK